jgi:L,D-peptidoglycan transpeptidase YkuD (ErfK/YbiS/YcfS/YnhG family)
MLRRGDMLVTRWGVQFRGRRFPATIGRGGISASKREGDGATPVGVHRIVGLYYRADRVGVAPQGATAIGPGDLWSDDPADPDYNHGVRAPHGFSHEKLRRADPQYDLVLVTDWNWPDAVPGLGSAIFIHQWRRPHAPTAGCVGLRRGDLRWIVARVRLGTRVVVRG